MVYNEKAYREIFPEVKITKEVAPAPETMVPEPDETPAATPQENELEVDAPDPVQEGGENESGNDNTDG